MGLNNAAKNVMWEGLAGVVNYASLHSADPSTTGDNEIAGAGRQACGWAAAASGQITWDTLPTWTVPSSTTFAYVGFWSASSGGTFYGYGTVPSQTYTQQASYTLDSATFSF